MLPLPNGQELTPRPATSLYCAISAWAGERDIFGSVFFALGVVAVVGASAARVIAAEPESNTGTKRKITANDQISPIATTSAMIVAIDTRTCIPPVVASYFAGRDIATESDTTGSNSDMATNDQTRPIATTTVIIHASICIPHRACRR